MDRLMKREEEKRLIDTEQQAHNLMKQSHVRSDATIWFLPNLLPLDFLLLYTQICQGPLGREEHPYS